MRPFFDAPLQRILSAPTWRARFFEAAAKASATLVNYCLRHHDPAGAEIWMGRLSYFREKARLHG